MLKWADEAGLGLGLLGCELSAVGWTVAFEYLGPLMRGMRMLSGMHEGVATLGKMPLSRCERRRAGGVLGSSMCAVDCSPVLVVLICVSLQCNLSLSQKGVLRRAYDQRRRRRMALQDVLHEIRKANSFKNERTLIHSRVSSFNCGTYTSS